MLKNSKFNLISSCFHLQCYKCREISVTWWNDWWVYTGVSESTAEHRIFSLKIFTEWQSDANVSQNPCLCNGCPWALKHIMKILNTETFPASITLERKKREFFNVHPTLPPFGVKSSMPALHAGIKQRSETQPPCIRGGR